MNRREFLKAAALAAMMAPITGRTPMLAFSPGAPLIVSVDAEFDEIFGSAAWLRAEQHRCGT